MVIRLTRAIVVLVVLCSSGCRSLVSTAVSLPFEVARHAQSLTVAQIEGGIKIAEGAISLADHAGRAIYQHQIRRAELGDRLARARNTAKPEGTDDRGYALVTPGENPRSAFPRCFQALK